MKSGLQNSLKQILCGKENRVAVGGRTDGAEEADLTRKDSTEEPVFFHPIHRDCYKALYHRFFVKHVNDMNLGEGAAGVEAATQMISYAGVAFTERRKSEVWHKMHIDMAACMCTEGCNVYNAKMAAVMREEAQAKSEEQKKADEQKKAEQEKKKAEKEH